MNRRTEHDFRSIWRRISPRYFKLVITVIALLVISYALFHISTQYTPTETTTEETTTTTTPTTTPETTTEKPFGKYSFRRKTNQIEFFFSSGLGCFHEHTQITLADGSTRSLNALHTGDEVLVHSSSGQFRPSRVLTVFHHQRSSVRFLDLYTTENSQPLRLTPSHSILTKNGYDFASNLLVGDWLISSEFQSIQITKIEEIVLVNQTISTPLTFEGNIIANNLIASCYATFNHQSMHWITTPIRYWYQIERFSRWNSYLVHLIDFYSMI